MASELKFVVVF